MLARNLASMSALSLYRNAIQFSLNIVMARFILPADYGLLVFTAPFLAFCGLMTDMGLSSAIVRSDTLGERQIAAAFTVTVAVGVALAALLCASAFPVAHLVHMRGLGAVMGVMSATVLLNVVSTVPRALLERRLHYGTIAGVEAASVMIAAVAALVAVAYGAGVWALIGYNLLSQSMRAIGFGWLARAEIRLETRWAGLKPLLSFGGWVLATNGLTFLSRNTDNILIGAVLGAAALGVYGLSYQFMMAPLMAITWPSSAVLFAMLSRQALRPERMRETVRGVFSATAALAFPAMVYLSFGLAFPVHALLPARWSGVPALVSWLAPLGAVQAIASYSGAILMANGFARRQFLLNLANAVLTVATFVATVRLGLLPLVWAYVGVSALASLGTVAITVRSTALGWADVGRALRPAALATGAGLALAGLLGRLGEGAALHWGLETVGFAAGVLFTYALMFEHIRLNLAVLVRPPDLPEPAVQK